MAECPDCAVSMEPTSVTAEGIGDLYAATEREDGILKRLGVDEHASIDAFLCPECGLTRLYTDIE